MVTEEAKKEIANKVVESLVDTILEEIEHYMFSSGKYDETDTAYMTDQATIYELVAKQLTE